MHSSAVPVLGCPVADCVTCKEQECSGGTANLTRSIVLAGVGSYLADDLRTRRAKIFIEVNRGICDSQPAYRAVLRGLFAADARLHPEHSPKQSPHGLQPLPRPWLWCRKTTQQSRLGPQVVEGQLRDGREGDRARWWGGSPAQALPAVPSETQGTKSARAGRSRWRPWLEQGLLSTALWSQHHRVHPMLFGDACHKVSGGPRGRGQVSGTAAGCGGHRARARRVPPGAPTGVTRLGWQRLAPTPVCTKTTRWH